MSESLLELRKEFTLSGNKASAGWLLDSFLGKVRDSPGACVGKFYASSLLSCLLLGSSDLGLGWSTSLRLAAKCQCKQRLTWCLAQRPLIMFVELMKEAD